MTVLTIYKKNADAMNKCRYTLYGAFNTWGYYKERIYEQLNNQFKANLSSTLLNDILEEIIEYTKNNEIEEITKEINILDDEYLVYSYKKY